VHFTSYMQEALTQAQRAQEAGEVPIGAVITHQGQIIAKAHNLVESADRPFGHAELLVIEKACQVMGSPRLPDCDLYVTLEPCPMCAHAISLARIRRLYFGAYDPKGGGVEHGPRIYHQPTCHHAPEVYGGMEETKCASILKGFFKERRS
jgi:tRNA(adenine34) deaminase